LIDISGRIPPSTVAVFEAIHRAADKGGISFFAVGATARNMLLRYAHQIPVRRATRDIDIAVRIADWNEYNHLVNILISTGDFKPTKLGHRFLFKETEPIDIVPFGPIAGTKHTVAWPPTEDTEDFYYVAENYIDAGNDDRLYNEASDLMDVESFDLAVAGARLLGRDMDRLAQYDAHRKVHEILARESNPSGSLRLISDIMGMNIIMQEKFDEIMALIKSVREGFLDRLR